MKMMPVLKGLNLMAAGALVWSAAQALAPADPVVVNVEAPAPVVITQFVPILVKPMRPPRRPDRLCLALNIYHEARGEPVAGQVAVGQVTLNRTAARYKGAETVCDTVFLRKQFSWTHESPRMPSPAELRPSLELADRVIAGEVRDRSNGALHYYNPKKVDAYWKDDYAEVAVLGNHRFMR